jgi:Uma2 family endonuclease
MALELAELPVRPITADEAMRMVDAGILEESGRIELLLGLLVEKPVKSGSHEDVKQRLIEWLWPVGPAALRFERPLMTPDGISMPEPDLAVGERGSSTPHPTTADLVIEVAVTSLKLHTTVKPALYASAGVKDYWVVDVTRRRVMVFRTP